MDNKKSQKNIEELLTQTGKSFRAELSSAERARLKSELFEKVSRIHEPHISPYVLLTSASWMRPVAAALLLVVIFVPTLWGAHTSLPGDSLYQVKTGFVERLPLITKFSPESRAEYYSDLAHTRLEESAELLRRDEYTEERVSKLDEILSRNVDAALLNANKASDSNDGSEALEAIAELEAYLKVHKEIVRRGGLERSRVEELSLEVESEQDENIEEFIDESTTDELSDASEEILNDFEKSLSTDTEKEVIDQIRAALIEANGDIRARDYREAYKTLIESDSDIEASETLIEILDELEREEEE